MVSCAEHPSGPAGASLRAGDWVQVRSKEEILCTLDKSGMLEGLPFMPEMFRYCGQRFRVTNRAHKTCDTVDKTGGRRMARAVHLADLRCDGSAHGGCQAACLLFWKEEWLAPIHPDGSVPAGRGMSGMEMSQCLESNVIAATRAPGSGDGSCYACQATRLPAATTYLPWWDVRQYIEDFTSGNVELRTLAGGFVYSVVYHLTQAGLGLGRPLRWMYDRWQRFRKGVPFPRRTGTIGDGQPTPDIILNLQPGEWVRVKSYEEILKSLNTANRNRGLFFDAEMVPYCGGVYQILARVNQIIDERTGRMLKFKNGGLILGGVVCQSRYSDRRLFCPRRIYSYWREAWLERVNADQVPGFLNNEERRVEAH